MLPTISGEFGVVQDPDIRFRDDGSVWAKIRGKAVKRTQDKQGNWADGELCFIDILVSKNLAKYVADSVLKGSTITVTGTLHFKEWEDNEGRKQKTHSIWADSIGVTPKFAAVREVDQPPARAAVAAVAVDEEAPF
jgi:single-strand DNA-binding protein